MKKVLSVILLAYSVPAFAVLDQTFTTPTGTYIIPSSSIDDPSQAGRKMFTNLVLFKPNSNSSDHPSSRGETPASIACAYNLTTQVPGCPIKGTSQLPNTGWGAIAVVEAYDNPYAEDDLNTFSSEFGLPACTTANGCFSVVYSAGSQPAYDAGSADEHVLDIEWAHAMAPNAKIIMVEAPSPSVNDMMTAVDVASSHVVAAGGGEVSDSWGDIEFAGETANDSHFQTPGIVYFASSGDYSAPARYPGSSPYVVSAGGSSIQRDGNGNYIGQTAWNTNPNVPIGQKSGGSGGPSLYEPRPSYQYTVRKIVGNARGTPDIAFDADPSTGVDVYSTAHGGWLIDGGTSVSAPALAGIVNSANHRASSSYEELTYIYNNTIKYYHNYWADIVSGYNGFPCLPGYDFDTGWGTPWGYGGK